MMVLMNLFLILSLRWKKENKKIRGDCMRLDMELVHRNMFESRSKAQASIKSGIIYCDQQKITKSSYDVNSDTQIEIRGEVLPYVSRAGLKLEKALDIFSISLDGKTMVDIGSSTGGFTDCALSHHIKKVIAVDVGSNQLHPKLRNHPQVELYEQTDFRDIDLDILNGRILDLFDESEKVKYSNDSTIEVEVSSMLHNLGIPSHVKGYKYIREGIMLLYSSEDSMHLITKEIYPEIATRYNTTSSRVERAIRHAIEISWIRGDLKLMENIFGNSIDFERSRPTNSEFLTTIADRLKLKNRQFVR